FLLYFFCVFFFQAEDGIRAFHVTGVQTCALPISALLILNDFFTGLKKSAKVDLVSCVANKEQPWTLVVVSNDPLVMAACDRVVRSEERRVGKECRSRWWRRQ